MTDQVNSLEELGAVATGEEAPVAVNLAEPREPVRDALGRSYATGKRKDAVARVWIKPGSGKVVVNGKEMNAYFARPVLQMILRQPFTVAGVEDQFDVMATVKGGGLSGQAGAVKHGRNTVRPKPVRASSSPSANCVRTMLLERAVLLGGLFLC